MKTTKKGMAFISLHEGNPTTAYLDPVGIPTIGHGFTMRSAAVKKELAKLGIDSLIPGKTKITKTQSDAIFAVVLASKEFEGAVNAKMPKNRHVEQYQFDAMSSATWNLGAGFMGWSWIKPWRDYGDISGSAKIWANNYNTAKGKKLPGLVRRRKEEAKLFEFGIYTGVKDDKIVAPDILPVEKSPEGVERGEINEPPKTPDPVVEEAQDALKELKIDPELKSDGWMGPKTEKAVIAYQKLHPHLKVDGKIGIATLTQLRKDLTAVKSIATDTAVKGGLTSVISSGAAFFVGLPWGWIAAGVIVLSIGYFSWKYRDVLKRKFNSIIGRKSDPNVV